MIHHKIIPQAWSDVTANLTTPAAVDDNILVEVSGDVCSEWSCLLRSQTRREMLTTLYLIGLQRTAWDTLLVSEIYTISIWMLSDLLISLTTRSCRVYLRVFSNFCSVLLLCKVSSFCENTRHCWLVLSRYRLTCARKCYINTLVLWLQAQYLCCIMRWPCHISTLTFAGWQQY